MGQRHRPRRQHRPVEPGTQRRAHQRGGAAVQDRGAGPINATANSAQGRAPRSCRPARCRRPECRRGETDLPVAASGKGGRSGVEVLASPLIWQRSGPQQRRLAPREGALRRRCRPPSSPLAGNTPCLVGGAPRNLCLQSGNQAMREQNRAMRRELVLCRGRVRRRSDAAGRSALTCKLDRRGS